MTRTAALVSRQFAVGDAAMTLAAPEWLCEAVASVLGAGVEDRPAGQIREIRLEPVEPVGEQWRLVVPDGEAVAGPLATNELVDAVVSQFTRQTVLGHPDEWFLHAGAVQRAGAAVAVVAPSGTGKSTLTAKLLQRGYEYLSDELAWLQPSDLTVRPFPKPLGLDERSHELLGIESSEFDRRLLRVEEQGWRSAGALSQLGLVVSLVRRGDSFGSEKERLTGADQAAALLVNQLNFLDQPDPLAAVCKIMSIAPVVRLVGDDLDDAARRIELLLVDRPDHVEVLEHLDLMRWQPSGSSPHRGAGPVLGPFSRLDPAARIRAAAFGDGSAIALNCESGEFVRTDALGFSLVVSLGSGRSISEVARSVSMETKEAVLYFEQMRSAGIVVPDLRVPS